MDWLVTLSKENIEESGNYQIVTLVNYTSDIHMSVWGKEKLENLSAKIERDSEGWVNYSLKDTYYGTLDLYINFENKILEEHVIYLSKNTNTIKLTVEFEDEYGVDKLESYRSYLVGDNGEYNRENTLSTNYGWQNITYNTLTDNEMVSYKYYESSYGDGNNVIVDYLKTMRMQTFLNLKLKIEMVEDSEIYTEVIDIPKMLAKVEKNGVRVYDTDEKLERYNYFEITVRINSNFVVVTLIIDSWYLVLGGVDL
ncbi:MAG: FimB/Mfa2 family fimbrial subunit [Odoribacter sp.]|nr:FimB/Mfa2 family fimbrial subunit [Odoribacter sp.]